MAFGRVQWCSGPPRKGLERKKGWAACAQPDVQEMGRGWAVVLWPTHGVAFCDGSGGRLRVGVRKVTVVGMRGGVSEVGHVGEQDGRWDR